MASDNPPDTPWFFDQDFASIRNEWNARRAREGNPVTPEENARFESFWEVKLVEAEARWPKQYYFCRWYAESETWKYYENHDTLDGYRCPEPPTLLSPYQLRFGPNAVERIPKSKTGSSVTPIAPMKKGAGEVMKQVAKKHVDQAVDNHHAHQSGFGNAGASNSKPVARPAPPSQLTRTRMNAESPVWRGWMAPAGMYRLARSYTPKFNGNLTLDGSPMFSVACLKPNAETRWNAYDGPGTRLPSVEEFTDLAFLSYESQSGFYTFVQPRERQVLDEELVGRLTFFHGCLQEWSRTTVEENHGYGRVSRSAMAFYSFFRHWLSREQFQKDRLKAIKDFEYSWRMETDPDPAIEEEAERRKAEDDSRRNAVASIKSLEARATKAEIQVEKLEARLLESESLLAKARKELQGLKGNGNHSGDGSNPRKRARSELVVTDSRSGPVGDTTMAGRPIKKIKINGAISVSQESDTETVKMMPSEEVRIKTEPDLEGADNAEIMVCTKVEAGEEGADTETGGTVKVKVEK
ncbi:hypothetical protein VTL71DRAFT_4951 [Oculimacula yallundae]|uniref:Uncharacterized protein n=1 Tax=Oculimacula yallundae TaxID=86028 RepID=A0ABR4C4L6_9HELO